MATTKILKVNILEATVNYCCKKSKTDNGKYITIFQCNQYSLVDEFELVNLKRKKGKGVSNRIKKDWKNKEFMIIQSFKPNEVTPDMAHEIGVKLAKEYLKDEHQYIVTTHIDKDHIHNHIVFNATKFTDFHSFDSKTKHMVDDLQKASDSLCEEYGLSVIREKKEKGKSYGEWQARKHDRSWKYKLEKIIDQAIKNSDTWQDFLDLMEQNCNVKYGKHISFKQIGQERFTRGRSLGLNYTEESIKFRIEHKEIEFEKPMRYPKLIDKSQAKFQGKENGGLRYWATLQNINALSSYISQYSKYSKEEKEQKYQQLLDSNKEITTKIDEMDAQIKTLQDIEKAIPIYKQGYGLIKQLKASSDKVAFKKSHVKELKEWDKAKKILSEYKTKNGVAASLKDIQSALANLETERSMLYLDFQDIVREMNAIKQFMATEKTLHNTKKKEYAK
ncbi:relaxase/mobilization nuclease domain-containing protein [Clostridium sp.]|jgi:hypothetical protein|uniref:relaxase/mobilization nuclease domain-containing protein n=1 Tax=Clostridium sp. TaxID=1506 RepID=UPI00290042DA|nr:relaxase/mobilization nuclease domain-containing protein [Clostridium sp.]MDU2156333.1 relaxase/mobilization nuclease domain-containing protein [Clostridium sp.]